MTTEGHVVATLMSKLVVAEALNAKMEQKPFYQIYNQAMNSEIFYSWT